MRKLSKAALAERQEAIERVKEWLAESPRKKDNRPVIYTSLRRVSSSGMSRVIACFIQGKYSDGSPHMINASCSIAKIIGERIKSTNCGEGIAVSGCGMDMGFHIVYNLGMYLWPNGTEKPHSTRNGEPDNNGGYAIRQEWI